MDNMIDLMDDNIDSTYEIPSAALKKSLRRILERLPFSVKTASVIRLTRFPPLR